jgi:hypothetical protein
LPFTRASTVILGAILVGVSPITSAAQGGVSDGPAVLRGFVLAESSETPIAGAEVFVGTLRLRAVTAADGAFRVGGIAPGTYIVLVRTLGFEPVSARLRFAPGDSLERDFLLVRAPVAIAGVDVKANVASVRNPKMAVFEARMERGIGGFITQATLDSLGHKRMGDIIAARVSGATVVSRNSSAWIAARRGQQSIRPRRQGMVGSPGADRSACYAAVYLDGALVYGGQEGETLFDVNMLKPSEVAGIEYYAGAAQVPTELNATLNTCGVLVIWTR